MRRYIYTHKKEIIKNIGFVTILILGLSLLLIFIPELMYARPGGGHSYSGGSNGGGGGGNGIAGLIIYLILQLPPQVSIPLIIIIIVFSYYSKRKKSSQPASVVSTPTYQNKSEYYQQVESQIEKFKQIDENFSRLLFLDFVSSVYQKYYSYFGKKEFKNLKPFLSDSVWANATKISHNQREIVEIVIGSIDFVSIFESGSYVGITVDIKSNYTIRIAGKSSRYILTERWLFNRKMGVLSLSPEGMRDLKCPNCGAPANFTDTGKCEYCNTEIQAGDMQWSVNQINIHKQEIFTAKGLTHYEKEVGTDYPTVVHPEINNYINHFTKSHNLPDWNSYWNNFTDNIAVAFFKEIYKAWSDLKWQTVRHLLSDRLYESYNFWIQNYKKEKLVNRLDNIQIRKIDIAAIEVDKYYESFTVRIFASCFDYVINNQGKVVGGSKKTPRVFSEYWTFMRRTGVEVKESEFSLHNCPNCGAPADKMGQAAVCEYCGAKISNGDFSWILTMIIQDEEYSG